MSADSIEQEEGRGSQVADCRALFFGHGTEIAMFRRLLLLLPLALFVFLAGCGEKDKEKHRDKDRPRSGDKAAAVMPGR